MLFSSYKVQCPNTITFVNGNDGITLVNWTWTSVMLSNLQEDTRSSFRMPVRWQESTVSAFTLPFICAVHPHVSVSLK